MDRREVATGLHDAPDEALLVAFANGDAAAGRALLGRLAPRLFAHAARVLGDRAEAEDVVQETMLRLWKQAPDWRQGEAKVSTWAYRVAVNLCTDRLRARKRRGHVDLDSVPDPPSLDPSAVERMTETVRNTALDAALGTLPDRQQDSVRQKFEKIQTKILAPTPSRHVTLLGTTPRRTTAPTTQLIATPAK